MYVDTSTIKKHGKTYTRHLLRECYREDGKIKHRTVANISHCPPEEIQAIKIALRRKHDPVFLNHQGPSLHIKQGLSCGAVLTVCSIAKELGITDVLGSSQAGKRALWQVCARVIDQGSRLSAVRLAETHAACDILGLDAFNENDLYSNLDWLAENQEKIENQLFARLPKTEESGLYLYDVTSSYLEGEKNYFSAFGYNRDGKKSKRQIVIGLLCNAHGVPVSIEVFPGNTSDPKTVASQVTKLAERFGGGKITLVGDRGMIKGPQIEGLPENFCYITAITKPQIESLLTTGVFQRSLFEQELSEIIEEDGTRYILRRNPIRAEEIAINRSDKLAFLRKEAAKSTTYLSEHPRAKTETQERALNNKIKHFKVDTWANLQIKERTIAIQVDEDAIKESANLDGCYVIKTNLSAEAASKETVHGRYKDLAMVEHAFRTSKTVELEMRPIHVRLEGRTRGHAFVVMMAYRIVQELANRWAGIDVTVQEGLDRLASLSTQAVSLEGTLLYQTIPEPSDCNLELLNAARVMLPPSLTHRGVEVTTKTKLSYKRKVTKKT
jgi:hypothetical protein